MISLLNFIPSHLKRWSLRLLFEKHCPNKKNNKTTSDTDQFLIQKLQYCDADGLVTGSILWPANSSSLTFQRSAFSGT